MAAETSRRRSALPAKIEVPRAKGDERAERGDKGETRAVEEVPRTRVTRMGARRRRQGSQRESPEIATRRAWRRIAAIVAIAGDGCAARCDERLIRSPPREDGGLRRRMSGRAPIGISVRTSIGSPSCGLGRKGILSSAVERASPRSGEASMTARGALASSRARISRWSWPPERARRALRSISRPARSRIGATAKGLPRRGRTRPRVGNRDASPERRASDGTRAARVAEASWARHRRDIVSGPRPAPGRKSPCVRGEHSAVGRPSGYQPAGASP
jgi:hypothetical protein